MFKFAAFLGVLALVGSGLKCDSDGYEPSSNLPFRHDPLKHHEKLWDSAKINASQVFRIDKSISIYLENKKNKTLLV